MKCNSQMRHSLHQTEGEASSTRQLAKQHLGKGDCSECASVAYQHAYSRSSEMWIWHGQARAGRAHHTSIWPHDRPAPEKVIHRSAKERRCPAGHLPAAHEARPPGQAPSHIRRHTRRDSRRGAYESFMLLFTLPILSSTLLLKMGDLHSDTPIFDPIFAGDPMFYQHLFLFFGHPEVYILIIPALEIISRIIYEILPINNLC